MAHTILAATTASISELKCNPMTTVAAGAGLPVVILNRSEPTFYCVPAVQPTRRRWNGSRTSS